MEVWSWVRSGTRRERSAGCERQGEGDGWAGHRQPQAPSQGKVRPGQVQRQEGRREGQGRVPLSRPLKTADTSDVRQLAEQGAQLVEVLPESSYSEEHLPGALNIPLAAIPERAPVELDPGRPVVVYCYDHECDLSARGAHLLDALGFAEVYDYVASKTAWLAHGLPVEGTKRASKRAGAIARRVPTCDLVDTVGDLVGRFSDEFGLCVVVDEAGVVLGVVRKDVAGLPPVCPLAS